jgi:hypothetical protein
MRSIASRSHRRMSVATWSVAAASGVQAFSRVAHQRGEALLDVQVHVLVVEAPGKFAALDLAGDLCHPALDVDEILRADDALAGEHPGVRERAADVLRGHALVEGHARRVALDKFGNGFGEAAGPGLGARVGGGVGAGGRRRGVCHNRGVGNGKGRPCAAGPAWNDYGKGRRLRWRA